MSDIEPPELPGDAGDHENNPMPGETPDAMDDLPPLMKKPEEENLMEPILSISGAAEAVLRQPRRIFNRIGESDGRSLALNLIFLSILGLLGYGFVVGTFTGGQQMWAAPVKVAGGVVASGLICLPSLYIFACLAGSRASLQQVIGLVAGLMTIMTFLLIGLAPVAWVFSQSTESVSMMGFLHLAFWTVAMYFAIGFFKSGFKVVVAQFDKGVAGVWVTVFVVVLLQMSTALRPIVGTSDTFLPTEKKFFIGHWFDNLEGEGGGRGSRASY